MSQIKLCPEVSTGHQPEMMLCLNTLQVASICQPPGWMDKRQLLGLPSVLLCSALSFLGLISSM